MFVDSEVTDEEVRRPLPMMWTPTLHQHNARLERGTHPISTYILVHATLSELFGNYGAAGVGQSLPVPDIA